MFRLLLLSSLLVPVGLFAAEPKVFTIKALHGQMRYDVTELTIAPGQEVKIIFENPDDMPHNMVFFQPGTDVVAVSNGQMESRRRRSSATGSLKILASGCTRNC
jgi:plastocyanin